MKESLLHYLWRYQKFQFTKLVTTAGETLVIERVGHPNDGEGPDFLLAHIRIAGLLFVGAVEIHLTSSGWYQHGHETDSAYDNVILHLVWEHDTEVITALGKPLPTLALKPYVSEKTLEFYQQHFECSPSILPCTPFVSEFPSLSWNHWRTRLYLERLEARLVTIEKRLKELEHDWEALLFEKLARAFGLNRNGVAFETMAQSIPFAVVRKIRSQSMDIEALFMGQANLLGGNDLSWYGVELKKRYDYLCHKFRLSPVLASSVQFARLRPTNFPTIRLSQLAQLHHYFPNLFEQFRTSTQLNGLETLSAIGVSAYWQTHYSLTEDAVNTRRPQKKKLTADFRSLLLINAVVPLLYAWGKWAGNDLSEWLFKQIEILPLEKNKCVGRFQKIGLPMQSALDSQAILQLYPNYCQNRYCLKCALGFFIMKQSP